ncbi:uridine kinase [Propionicimonas paludicola]|uniref:Uridine kinase n=1 Tax=Propionicimonas paludicola TaxID=185243 RepID=A0A2A9CRV9_9ACTN|nr:AAA family ATPase [Propionicimonas paludicola]PFG17164.1 uridine kinase [Propionicimonas paludicola]
MTAQILTNWEATIELALSRLDQSGLILIDGPSGSGKSTLARQLHQRGLDAGLNVRLLRLDDVYPGWGGLNSGALEVARDVVLPLAAGRPASWRPYDWAAGRKTEPREMSPGAGLIIEGVGALHPLGSPHAALRIWVTAEPLERRQRALERDGDTYRPHWERWAEQERSYFARTRPLRRADVILDTTTKESIDD